MAVLGLAVSWRQIPESLIPSSKRWNTDFVLKLLTVQIASQIISHYDSFKAFLTEEVILLQLIQMSPIVIIVSILWQTGNGILGFSCFQLISMVMLPYLYCQAYGIKMNIKDKFTRGPMSMKVQIPAGIFLFFGAFFVVAGAYYVCVYLFGTDHIMTMRIPLQLDLYHQCQFFFVFCGINPILEELFWRCFAGELLGNGEKSKWVVCANFGFYHFFVLYYIFQDPAVPVFLVGVITLYGRLLHFCKDFFWVGGADFGTFGS